MICAQENLQNQEELLKTRQQLTSTDRQRQDASAALRDAERETTRLQSRAKAHSTEIAAVQEELTATRTALHECRETVAEVCLELMGRMILNTNCSGRVWVHMYVALVALLMQGCPIAVQATVAAEKAEDARRGAEERCAMAAERAKAAQARVTQQLSIVSTSREQRATAEAAAAEAEARAEGIARRLMVAEAAAADARVRAQAAVDTRERLVDEADAAREEAQQQRQRVRPALLQCTVAVLGTRPHLITW